MPELTWAEVPSGATSVSRTTTVAISASAERWRTASGKPRASSGSASGSDV